MSNVYNILCFTTNGELYEPLTIMRKFTDSLDNNSKKLMKDNTLNFYYKINTQKILTSFHQIINFNNENKYICNLTDSLMILIDLEDDNTFQNLNEIINIMTNFCDLEKTIFIIGLYSNAQKIKSDLNEENIKEFLEEKKLLFEYFESNVESSNDLNKTIDFIILEGFKKVEKKFKDSENILKSESESNSNCIIF